MVVVEVRQGAGGEETRRGEEKRGEEEEKEEDEEEEDEEEATDIKSNNPHLAGGEKNWKDPKIHFQRSQINCKTFIGKYFAV